MVSDKINGTANLTQREELRRLLRYLAPYTLPLAAGILLMAVMGVAEGLVAFAIKPALDVVLNPQSALQKLVLFQVPGTDRIVGGGKTGILYLLDRGTMTEAQEFHALINAFDPTAAVDANWFHAMHMHGWLSWWKGADPSLSYDYY